MGKAFNITKFGNVLAFVHHKAMVLKFLSNYGYQHKIYDENTALNMWEIITFIELLR